MSRIYRSFRRAMATQTISAAQAVGEMLQSPDDLGKIATLRKKLEKEKASIDAKLKSGVKDQLDATREALRKLLGSRDNVQAIREQMISIDRMCSEQQNTVKTFDKINRVSAVHRNFVQTEEMVNNLLGMHEKLNVLEEMLIAERKDIPGPAPNLLRIHYQINQLETFRNQAMYQAKRAKEESRQIMEKWFERLNALIADFEEYLWTLARNILPIVRAGHPGTVVKLVKICEVEGKEDEKAIAIKLVRKAAKLDAAAKFKSMTSARTIKHYRSTLTKTITDGIKAALTEAYERFKADPEGFFDDLKWIYVDILDVQDFVAPCFPESYDIYSLYVRGYHKSLDTLLKGIVAEDPDAKTILAINAWVKKYKKTILGKEMNVPPELVEPPLLDGKEKELIQDYSKLIVKKMDQWTAELMKTETNDFVIREEPPESDAEGYYGMQGAFILFKMFNEQADAAADSGQGGILSQVVSEAHRIMRSTQDTWSGLIDAEYKKQVEKPEETPGGLAEYVIAVANDQIKCADFAEEMSARLEAIVTDKYKKEISDKLNDAIDGYLDVATKKCVTALIDLIFNDLRPAIKQLFTPTWYGGIMGQIILTIRDYMNDYQAHLNPSILGLLIEELLDTFIVTYLTALGNSSKLRMPATIDRIKDDVREAFQYFATLKPAKELERTFDVVDLVLGLLEASRSMAFLSYWDFAKVHGPNVQFVEALMRAREDLDRTAVSEVMESVRRKVKEDNIIEPEEPTIMKKIQLQSTFQRLLNTARS